MVNFVLSLFGPAYFGYRRTPYWAVVAWALVTAAYFLWRNKASIRYASQHSADVETVPPWYVKFSTILLYLLIASGILVAHSALYYLIGKVS